MSQKTQVEQLAAFVLRASFDELSGQALERWKLHVLDSLGCAIGALDSEPTRAVRRQARPMPAEQVREKFRALTADHVDDGLGSEIRDMALNLENVPVKDLTNRLAQAAADPPQSPGGG
jgi:2-methylcitrate dehydratase PrpD